jgi:hypothetical protein
MLAMNVASCFTNSFVRSIKVGIGEMNPEKIEQLKTLTPRQAHQNFTYQFILDHKLFDYCLL